MAGHVGELAVTPTLAVGNPLKRPLTIEQCTSGEALNERHTENPPLAVEILPQFSLCLAEVGLGLLPQGRTLSDRLAKVGLRKHDSVVLILTGNSHDPVLVCREQQGTDGAVDNTMSERHARSLARCCCSGAPGTLPP